MPVQQAIAGSADGAGAGRVTIGALPIPRIPISSNRISPLTASASMIAALRYRDFRWLWAGTFCATAGQVVSGVKCVAGAKPLRQEVASKFARRIEGVRAGRAPASSGSSDARASVMHANEWSAARSGVSECSCAIE